jgi:hypothetical protein
MSRALNAHLVLDATQSAVRNAHQTSDSGNLARVKNAHFVLDATQSAREEKRKFAHI